MLIWASEGPRYWIHMSVCHAIVVHPIVTWLLGQQRGSSTGIPARVTFKEYKGCRGIHYSLLSGKSRAVVGFFLLVLLIMRPRAECSLRRRPGRGACRGDGCDDARGRAARWCEHGGQCGRPASCGSRLGRGDRDADECKDLRSSCETPQEPQRECREDQHERGHHDQPMSSASHCHLTSSAEAKPRR
jgi:hypothetical protein